MDTLRVYAATLLLALLASPTLRAQTTPASRLTFEVASLRPSAPDVHEPGNLDLDPSDYYRYQGGTITTSGQLIDFLIFAWKISDRAQAALIVKQLPAWASQRYTLHATVEGRPSKDQLRLMVQSLLAERFHLKLHLEPRLLPIYALVLDHQPAPGLTPASVEGLCAKPFERRWPASGSTAPSPSCGLIVLNQGPLKHVRIMDWTMDQIAGSLVLASLTELDPRPIVDQTGLTGRFDLNLEFLRPQRTTGDLSAETTPSEPGATFEEALKQQAGLKLIRQTGTAPVYVIDHLEPPSEN
jgi:uncharacterized protein (TIGR03435 family)